MKIIFLDIDGVLNNELFYNEEEHEKKQHDIDERNLKLLNELIQETGAKVVITSTWRLGKTEKELQNILEQFGFTGEIIGTTKHYGKPCLRRNEILEWIETHEELIGQCRNQFTEYVIFDDDSDMLYWQRDNFICVDSYVGLTPRNIYKAEWMLNGRKYKSD